MNSAAAERAEAAKLPKDDVVGVLLSQHARIRDLFAEVKSAEGEHRRRKFDELRGLLAVHESAEEMIVRPVAKKAASEREATARNAEEKEASRVLAELERMEFTSEEFRSTLGELESSVSEHANLEERDEFPALIDHCSEDERIQMGSRLLAAERAAPTHPHPGAAGSTPAQWTVGPFASLLDHARDAIARAG